MSSTVSPGLSLALVKRMAAVASAGVDWIQIREKDLSARELAKLTRAALRSAASQRAANPLPSRIVVNDRLDVALTERAGGVHLGESSLPLSEVKGFTSSHASLQDFLIGVSCHSAESAKAATGADYIFFGPVFATPSKSSFGEPQGLVRLAEVCRAIPLPVLAIGGITLKNAGACFEAGAAGLAAIRLFQDAADLPSMIQELRTFTSTDRR